MEINRKILVRKAWECRERYAWKASTAGHKIIIYGTSASSKR